MINHAYSYVSVQFKYMIFHIFHLIYFVHFKIKGGLAYERAGLFDALPVPTSFF